MKQALVLQALHMDFLILKAVVLPRECASQHQLGLNPTDDFFLISLPRCPSSRRVPQRPGPSVSPATVWGCTRPLSPGSSRQPAPYLHFSMTASASLSLVHTHPSWCIFSPKGSQKQQIR